MARIIEKSAIRYTPAGIPIASAILMHSSQQVEAGTRAIAEFEISHKLQVKFQENSPNCL
jgi:primosomal replication protein N